MPQIPEGQVLIIKSQQERGGHILISAGGEADPTEFSAGQLWDFGYHRTRYKVPDGNVLVKRMKGQEPGVLLCMPGVEFHLEEITGQMIRADTSISIPPNHFHIRFSRNQNRLVSTPHGHTLDWIEYVRGDVVHKDQLPQYLAELGLD